MVVGQAGLTPGVMADALATSGTALSFHLKELVHAGLVTQRSETGATFIYRARRTSA